MSRYTKDLLIIILFICLTVVVIIGITNKADEIDNFSLVDKNRIDLDEVIVPGWKLYEMSYALKLTHDMYNVVGVQAELRYSKPDSIVEIWYNIKGLTQIQLDSIDELYDECKVKEKVRRQIQYAKEPKEEVEEAKK
jgi:hypothetical protein